MRRKPFSAAAPQRFRQEVAEPIELVWGERQTARRHRRFRAAHAIVLPENDPTTSCSAEPPAAALLSLGRPRAPDDIAKSVCSGRLRLCQSAIFAFFIPRCLLAYTHCDALSQEYLETVMRDSLELPEVCVFVEILPFRFLAAIRSRIERQTLYLLSRPQPAKNARRFEVPEPEAASAIKSSGRGLPQARS
jgi:hypothetical protein